MGLGRISTNYAFLRSIRTINNSFLRMDELREKMNTGKEVNKPSDDPVALQKIFSLGTSIKENERYQGNLEDGLGRLNAAATTLEQVENALVDLIDIVTVAASDATTSAERISQAQQVNSLLEELISLANSDFRGKFLFGGIYTLSGTCPLMKPFNTQYASDGTTITGVIPNPRGINDLVNTTILPGLRESINISGAAPFQPNGSKGVDDVFNVLIQLRDRLQQNDINGIRQSEEEIQDALSMVIEEEAILGSKISKFETTLDTLQSLNENEISAKSKVEDADYAKLLIEFSTAETLLNATLSATSTLLQNSLMNFI